MYQLMSFHAVSHFHKNINHLNGTTLNSLKRNFDFIAEVIVQYKWNVYNKLPLSVFFISHKSFENEFSYQVYIKLKVYFFFVRVIRKCTNHL